ncbi:MAG: hypothetical protein Q9183_004519 [Haloplaca sp. 2 TL-2023]
MKRKFSFSSLRLKLSGAPTEDAITPEGLDSPPYSPTPSCMERPVIPSDIIAELRVSCAFLVNETNPPEYDDVPNQREMLKKYIQERDAHRALAEKRAAREKRFEAASGKTRRPESSDDVAVRAPYRHVPQNAASNFETTTSARKPSFSYLDIPSFEPLEPTHTTASGLKTAKPERNEALEQIRATLDVRPKTSAAACIDYSGPSVESSKSTSRSNTTYNEFGRPSTGQTSLAITPGDDKRMSYTSGRASDPPLNDSESSASADVAARAWMAQELARRRAEYQSTGQAARPGSRATMQRPGSSRAGSIAESVIEGVRDYIRPRASMDSMRSDYNGLSRSHSRSGSSSIKSNKSNTWQRVKGLRRKNSWSSFRSAKVEPEPATSTAANGEVNLNRALPALPGLDQYKEKKAKPTHIAQMMGGAPRAKSVPNVKASQQQQQQQQQQQSSTTTVAPTTRPNKPPRNMSNPEESRRQQDLRRAVEEKMRKGAIAENQHLQPHPLVQGNSFYALGEGCNGSTTSAAMQKGRPQMDRSRPVTAAPDMQTAAGQGNRKPGLKKKLSRFWGFGDRGKGGKMVATN